MGKKIKRKHLKNETKVYIYDFQQYKTIRSFGDNIYTCKFNIDEAEMDESNLFKKLVKFDNRSRPKTTKGKDKKEILMKVHMLFNKVEN